MTKRTLKELYNSSHLFGNNASWIESLYEDWLDDEQSVPPHWAETFSTLRADAEGESGHLAIQEKFRHLGRLPAVVGGSTEFSDQKEAAVVKLITAYRIRGHEAAQLDPLGQPHHVPPPDLDPAFHGLGESDMDREFDTATLFAPERMKLRDIIALCRRVYCGSIGIETIHITDTAKRRWMQERLETASGPNQKRSKHPRRRTLRRNMAVNCSEMRLKSSWMAVLLPMKVAAMRRPRGGMSQTAVFTLFGIQSTK